MGKNQDMLKCLHCLKQFKNCGNTTNMMKHLENQHPLLSERRNKSSEPTNVVARRVNDEKLEEITNTLSKRKRKSIGSSHSIVDAFKKVEAFKDGGVEADKITNTILFFICKDLMPLSVIDNEGFTLLLKILVPLYQTPSRKTINTKLELRYEILKNRIVNQLKTLNYYCLTCDKWSDCTNKTYIGMTVHYTDTNNLMSRCLGCIPVYDRQTTENLKVEILQILNVFELKIEKITAFVTDGETALKKAVQELVGKDKHLWCVAHILALLIPDSLTNLSILTSVIDKVKSIVTFIKRSNVASNKLQQLQINMGKSEGTSLNLLQDVSTRWTTKVNMIERYLELEELVYLTLSFAAYDAEKFLTREETQILINILPLMKTVTSIITEISGETYHTCNIIIPIIHCMKKSIENQEANTDVGIQFKNNLLYAISNRFKDFEKSSILSMSTIADPRFKKVHFTDRLAVHSALKRIDLQVKNLTVSENTSTEEVKDKINSVWEFHDQLELVNNVHQNESSYCLEIEQYLELKRISRKSNIFEYWMKVAPAFPRMSKIAIILLSILATTVPSERLFSKAGLIKVDHRNRLTAQHLNMLLFLSSLPRNDWDI